MEACKSINRPDVLQAHIRQLEDKIIVAMKSQNRAAVRAYSAERARARLHLQSLLVSAQAS